MLAAIGFAASRPRARLMAAAVSAQASALRDEMMTVAPCSASRSAMARPMPREEPVTIATRPVKSNRLVKISSDGQRAASTIALFAGPTLEGVARTLLVAAMGRTAVLWRRPLLPPQRWHVVSFFGSVLLGL